MVLLSPVLISGHTNSFFALTYILFLFLITKEVRACGDLSSLAYLCVVMYYYYYLHIIVIGDQASPLYVNIIMYLVIITFDHWRSVFPFLREYNKVFG